jgi:hypothetical protein
MPNQRLAEFFHRRRPLGGDTPKGFAVNIADFDLKGNPSFNVFKKLTFSPRPLQRHDVRRRRFND